MHDLVASGLGARDRIAHTQLGPAQWQIVQQIIALGMFVPFAVLETC